MHPQPDIDPGLNSSAMAATPAGDAGGGGVLACPGQQAFGSHPEEHAARFIQLYIFPVFLLIGSVGNVLSAALMHRLSVQVWSTCLYLSVLAVVELLVLYVECGNRWYRSVAEDLSNRIMTSSNALCKVYLFLFQFIRDLAPWIVVSVAVETMVATRWPLRTYVVCTRERARAVLLFITVLLVCLAMQYFWTYGLYQWASSDPSLAGGGGTTISCSYIEEFSESFRDLVWPYLSLVVGHVAPLLAVAGLLGVTLYTLLRDVDPAASTACGGAGDDRSAAAAAAGGRTRRRSTLAKYFLDLEALGELRIAATLVSLFYVVVANIRVVLQVVKSLMAHQVIKVPMCSAASVYAKLTLGNTLYETLFYAFLSTKIFIYLATCRRFRRDLVALFRSCRDSQGNPLCGALRCRCLPATSAPSSASCCCRAPRGSAVTHTDPQPAHAMESSSSHSECGSGGGGGDQQHGNPASSLSLPAAKQSRRPPKPRSSMEPLPGLPVTEEGIREARRGLGHPKSRSGGRPQGRASLEEPRAKVFPEGEDPFPRKHRGSAPPPPPPPPPPLPQRMKGMEGAAGGPADDVMPEAMTSLDDDAAETDPLAPYRYEYVASDPDVGLGNEVALAKGGGGMAVGNAAPTTTTSPASTSRSPKRHGSYGSDSRSYLEVNPGVNTDV